MEAKLEGNTLTLKVEIDTKGEPSSSGKSVLHYSTRGAITLPVKIGGKPLVAAINLYTKAKATK